MKIHQNYITLATAVGFALLVLLANIFLHAPEGKLRMGFAAALYLVSRDTLAGASIARGARSLKNPGRWLYAFYMALFFGSFMLLALWRGIDTLPARLPGTLSGAALFGTLMAFAFKTPPYPYAHHFKLESPLLPPRLGAALTYMAPPLRLVAIWAFYQASPHTPAYLFFYIILIGFAVPRYRRKSGGNILWANFPTLVGYVLLVALLFAPF